MLGCVSEALRPPSYFPTASQYANSFFLLVRDKALVADTQCYTCVVNAHSDASRDLQSCGYPCRRQLRHKVAQLFSQPPGFLVSRVLLAGQLPLV